MTKLLAWVADGREAALALAAGVGGVAVRAAGGPPEEILALAARQPVPAMVGWLEPDGLAFILASGSERRRLGVRPPTADTVAAPARADTEAVGVLLQSDARLLDALTIAALEAVIGAARDRGLAVALDGGIEEPDVPRLLPLGPDLLLVGRALRAGARRDGALDPARIAAMRTLVRAMPEPQARRMAAPRGDRIFVRDLVLVLDVGAYASELGAPQRVRFSVVAELAAAEGSRQGMDAVVSYDLVADAINRVAASPRTTFLETLAEAIAGELLAVPRIVEVEVRVEKLDRGSGALGIEIVRRAYEA